MVDIDDAIASTTTVTPGKLSLGEGSGGSATLTIANASASAQTYALSHVTALSTGPVDHAISPFGVRRVPRLADRLRSAHRA